MPDKFNPNDYMLNLKGKDYLPVAARVAWFRESCPIQDGWRIETEVIAGGREAKFATYRATIIHPSGTPVATAIKTEDVQGFADFEEKAETGSIGRALALCGFGTIVSLELDEGSERLADGPVARQGGQQRPPAGQQRPPAPGSAAKPPAADGPPAPEAPSPAGAKPADAPARATNPSPAGA
jgi:hypothetical protein